MSLGQQDLALLRDFLAAMEEAQVKCFLVGAGARLFAFDRRWNVKGARATLDWDFAVRAESWDHWSALTARLVRGTPARFTPGKSEHRFLHVDGAVLDLVPYGGVESPRGEILWPGQARMSVQGFRESEGGCELLDTGMGLTVPVAAIPSLALLKLHAYRDRRQRGERKDIQDFDWYLRNYELAGNESRVHEELGEALRSDLIGIQDAGAALLGLDVARMHTSDAITAAREILIESRDPWSKVTTDVLMGKRAADDDWDRRARDETCRAFGAFESGLELARLT